MNRRSVLTTGITGLSALGAVRVRDGNRTRVSASESSDGEPLTAESSRSSTVVGAPVWVRASGGSAAIEWTVRDAPEGSEATIRDRSARVTSIRPDEPGSYVLAATDDESATLEFEVDPRSAIVERFAPQIHFHEETEYRPTRLEALVENARLRRDGETVVSEPTVFDLAGRDDSHYLELRGDESDYPTYQEAYSPTVYANVTPETEYGGETYAAVTYWFVYTYDPKHGFASFGAHQADVESMVVLIDDDGRDAYVAAAAHGGMTIVLFEQAVSEGTHPDIYPEHRSHATFLRDTSAYDGDGYQTYSFWSDADADCGSINALESTFHSEWTGSNETWSHDESEGSGYQLVELTGTEVWTDYEGGLSDEPGSIQIPHRRQHYHDPGGRMADRGCPDHEQVSGVIEREDHVIDDGEAATVTVTVTNEGGKPHSFWVTVEPAGDDTETADNDPLALERVRVGTANPSLFGSGRSRSVTIEVEPPVAERELVAELWLHPPDVRRPHDLADATVPFRVANEDGSG